jgi:hypothetical protein
MFLKFLIFNSSVYLKIMVKIMQNIKLILLNLIITESDDCVLVDVVDVPEAVAMAVLTESLKLL